MKRTTIVADESTLNRLSVLARSRGVSMGHLVREALREKLEREQAPLKFLESASPAPGGALSARVLSEEDHFRAEEWRSS
ncbi:MAG: CopG family transcriptional regulator [Actinomycetota bacterium]